MVTGQQVLLLLPLLGCLGSGLSLSSSPTQSPGNPSTVSSTEAPACPMFQM